MARVISLAQIKEIAPLAGNFLDGQDLESLPLGRYDLDQGIYINVEEYKTYPRRERQYEAHKKYVDLQIVIRGEEKICVEEEETLRSAVKYDPCRDVAFYHNDVPGTEYTMKAGDCLVLFPRDGHMPCLNARENESVPVKKAVVKVPVTHFSQIRYLVMDVDGTLTDGKIYMGETGECCKAFSIKDGYGIGNLLAPAGIQPVIITGRESRMVENRCKELRIQLLFQRVHDKVACLDGLLEQQGLTYANVAYIGDDLNDYACMEKIRRNGGLTGCPKDAADAVVSLCDFVSLKNGGDGAVREFIEWLVTK